MRGQTCVFAVLLVLAKFKVKMMEKDAQAKVAWASYFLLGTGLLAPWNALLTGIDYFSSVFPGKPMDRLFTITYLPACLLVLVMLLRFRINSQYFTPYSRIVGSYIGFALIMLLIPVLDLFGVGPWPPEPGSNKTSPFFPAVLVATVVIGLLDGLCQGAVFADVAALPTHFTQAVVSGTACSGFLVSLLRILSKALWTEEQRQTGFLGLRASTELYFVAAAVLSLACAAAYGLVLPSLQLVQQMRRQAGGGGAGVAQVGAKEGHVGLPSLKASHSLEKGVSGSEGAWAKPPDEEAGGSNHESEQALLLSTKAQGEQNSRAETQSTAMQPDTFTTFRSCWQRLWRLCAGLLLTYTFTLSIFPGFLAEDTKDNDLGDWYPILLLFAFNTSDFLGKLLPSSGNTWKRAQSRAATEGGGVRDHLQRLAQWWLLAAASRFLFIPAFLAAAFLHIHPLLMGTLTVALGASNGYVTAGLMLGGPELLEAELQEAGEGLLVLSLITGLLIGALCGFLWLLI